MQRYAIMAALVLSPLMVHAQTASSAQPQAALNAPVLFASIGHSGAFFSGAAASALDRPTNPTALRISTGVVAPKLIHSVAIQRDVTSVRALAGQPERVTVSLVVDETGKPSDVKVVDSADANMNQSVIAAVSQFRFQPGTVSGQAVAVPMNLHLVIESAGQ